MVLYNKIEQAIRQYEESLYVGNEVIEDDIRHAIRLVMRNNPDIFWFVHQYHFHKENGLLSLKYRCSWERSGTIQRSIDDVVENDFHIDYVRTLTELEQVAYVYKWLPTYCNYNVNSAYNQNIDSVFVRRNSVCTGYARAAQYLFSLLGIESRLVFGKLHNDNENGRHCWNIVTVNNQSYHFDACFGDSILDGIALKSGVKELFNVEGINYNFLCISTDEMLETRSIEEVATLPACPTSWSKNLIKSLVGIKIKQRDGIKGCLLSHIGSSADIYLCSKDKNTVLKVFRSNSKTTSKEEYSYMQQTKGCLHVLQCNGLYTDISQNIIAFEQSTPIVDLLCSPYYELSLKGLIKITTDIVEAWIECRNRGVLYRDIHVCNIYRSNDGTFKLGDFGSCTNDFNVKETIGNQWFMAPETFVSGTFSEASAVYSISMVMYFILNNLRPAFCELEHKGLYKRSDSNELPMPIGCANLPLPLKAKIVDFFNKASAILPKERINSLDELIYELKQLTYYCYGSDYIIHHKGTGFGFYFDVNIGNPISVNTDHIFMSDWIEAFHIGNPTEIDRIESDSSQMVDLIEDDFAKTASWDNNDDFDDIDGGFDTNTSSYYSELHVDEVESFAKTMAFNPYGQPIFFSSLTTAEDIETYASTERTFTQLQETEIIESSTQCNRVPKSFFSRIIETCTQTIHKIQITKSSPTYFDVYSSIFAPAEVKRKSHFQVQVYLHLYEETEKVQSLAKESDKNAERRDYVPLSLKLRKGDKVGIEFNIYGESRLMSEYKSVIWQGSFTKCSFDYFVPKDIDLEELSCEANVFVNGIMVGEMRFITQIVTTPRNLNTEILSHRFNRIFISYAHQDAHQIKLLALAYKAQGVSYFYDRDSLAPGDIYEEKIFDYIDTSDLFVLCWSKNAAVSNYVAKEKGRALARAYPQRSLSEATLKICPISIEPRADLPNDMKDIYNFEEV